MLDDTVASNGIIYAPGERPDHVVVIKYVPSVGDSKRALDEYTSGIFLGGTSTLSIVNVCEDSLLAAPIMLDLVVLTELFSRVGVRRVAESAAAGDKAGAAESAAAGGKTGAAEPPAASGKTGAAEPPAASEQLHGGGEGLHTVLSLLSYFFKSPVVPAGAPVINGLHRQRDALVNFLRALIGLPPDSSVDLEARLVSEHDPKGERERERERERELADELQLPVVQVATAGGAAGAGRA